MKRLWVMLAVIVFLSWDYHAWADSRTEEILRSVVKIRSQIPQGASATEPLGTEREGNGIVIDGEGTILTLSFLVRDAEKTAVLGPDGAPVAASLIGYDYATGFALLRTKKPLGVTPVQLGQSSAVKTGDPIFVAGFGGGEALQEARVISRKEFAGSWEYLLEEAIFTAPATTDFSGSALLDGEGRLVGIGYLYTQVAIQGFGLLPCNMFIPIDLLTPMLADLKTTGQSLKQPRPWLGINAEEAHERVFITKVTAGGPAEKAGLKPGDMVLMVNGQAVKSLADFYRRAWGLGKAGVQVPLTVLQGVKLRDLQLLSGDRQKLPKSQPGKDMEI